MFPLFSRLHLGCIQGGPSGCTLCFVDVKTKVPSQYSLIILKRNSQFYVNKMWCTTLMDHPVSAIYLSKIPMTVVRNPQMEWELFDRRVSELLSSSILPCSPPPLSSFFSSDMRDEWEEGEWLWKKEGWMDRWWNSSLCSPSKFRVERGHHRCLLWTCDPFVWLVMVLIPALSRYMVVHQVVH